MTKTELLSKMLEDNNGYLFTTDVVDDRGAAGQTPPAVQNKYLYG